MSCDFPLIFERSSPGRQGVQVPANGIPPLPAGAVPAAYLRKTPPRLPELSEPEIVRHYTALSLRNHGVDNGFYPLGSCTMKYNPKINEDLASLPGFAAIHPLQDQDDIQGALAVMAGLEDALTALTGMARFSLAPAAGAHGELTGLFIIRAYHDGRGETKRRRILVPDTAHGTNPASAAMSGFEVLQVPSAPDGGVDLEALRARLDGSVAALMLTNPNTLGLFETRIPEIARAVHQAGGLLYYDGANLNAIMGLCRPADMGFDALHLNLHKTFATPHGGGGPGAGPVGVTPALAPYLPSPLVSRDGDGRYRLTDAGPLSIGRVRSFHGQFGVLIKAYAYILSLGAEGLRQASLDAVLGANYLATRLAGAFALSHAGPHMHEFVISARRQKAQGVHALDIAKRLIDYGFHPPTIYFPLIVEEAMMVEPTETEPLAVLDAFADAMLAIADEAVRDPRLLHEAPHYTPVGRLDEAGAARKPVLRWQEEGNGRG
ncbi:MAG: aminomethyl-transferring glycine dehydrogenase subunit GcvPB [Patescibacteria group bacterium]